MDLETLIKAASFLVFMCAMVPASMADIRERRVPDRCWVAMAVPGIIVESCAISIESGPVPTMMYLAGSSLLTLYALCPRISGSAAVLPTVAGSVLLILSIPGGAPVSPLPMFFMFLAMYRLRVIPGGADAKCLMIVSLILPEWPSDHGILSPALAMATAGSAMSAVWVLMVCRMHGSSARFPTVYRKAVGEADARREWPVQDMVGGRAVRCRATPDSAPEILGRLKAEGCSEVSVTPVAPFIPMLAVSALLLAIAAAFV